MKFLKAERLVCIQLLFDLKTDRCVVPAGRVVSLEAQDATWFVVTGRAVCVPWPKGSTANPMQGIEGAAYAHQKEPSDG